MRAYKTNTVTLTAAVFALSLTSLDVALAADANTSVSVEIGPQSLEAALVELSKQGHLQLVIATGSLPAAKMAEPLRGSMPLGVALDYLLKDTGLTYKLVGNHTIAIVKSAGPKRQLSEPPVSPGASGAIRPSTPNVDGNHDQGAEKKNATQGDQTVNHRSLMLRLATFLGICVSTAVQGPACAQNASVSETEGAPLEEIVVTAQKRSENLQQVPVSAQVINGQSLADLNLNTFAELNVPGLHIGNGGGSNELFVRGIGSGADVSFDQSVATFEDDVYHGRSRMTGATFFDLDHIEVLKGPQSTFFGNNAIAGALNITTKKPGDTFDASARLLYGQYGTYAAEGAVGGPITDTLGVRVAVTRNGGSGWIDNLFDGRKVPNVDNEAARLTLVFKPAENLDATFKIQGSRNYIGGIPRNQPTQFFTCGPEGAVPSGFGDLGICGLARTHGVPIGIGLNEISTFPGQFNSLSTSEEVLTLNYRQWGQTFTSVSAFSHYDFRQNADAALVPVVYLTTDNPENYHQFSQEFRVASDIGRPIEYLAGAYFQTDRLTYNNIYNDPFINFLWTANPALAPYLPSGPDASFGNNRGFSQDEKIYSVFGSLTWNVTDSLKMSGSLRQSWVSKDFSSFTIYGTSDQLYGGQTPLPPALQVPAGQAIATPAGASPPLSLSNQAFMPSARVQYQFNPNAMLYFRYDRGFLAGGFDGSTGFGGPGQLPYGPEHVNAYELGLKSTWLDDTVRVNLDVFRGDYRDLQVNAEVYIPVTKGFNTEVENAAQSRSQGVELEAQWAVSRDFRLSANVTYLDSKYISYPNASPTTLQLYCSNLSQAAYSAVPQCAAFPFPVAAFQNLAGKPTVWAPTWSGSIVAAYTVRLPADYKLTTELRPYFSTWYFLDDAVDDPNRAMGGYVRLDARMTLDSPGGHWALDLIGNNLTNRNILTSDSFEWGSKEEPHNVAVQFRYRW